MDMSGKRSHHKNVSASSLDGIRDGDIIESTDIQRVSDLQVLVSW